MRTTCGRDEHQAVHTFRCCVRHLETDGTAHRVPDENGLVDVGSVEDAHQRLGKCRNVEDVVTACTASVPGQVRDHVDPPSGEPARRGHQVLAGDRKAVDVNDRRADRARAAAAVDGLAVDLHELSRPRDIGRHGRILPSAAGEVLELSRQGTRPRRGWWGTRDHSHRDDLSQGRMSLGRAGGSRQPPRV